MATIQWDTFMECTSLSINYDVMGRATVSYVLVSQLPELEAWTTIEAGGQIFKGYVASINLNQIPKTQVYENHVTLIATTDA